MEYETFAHKLVMSKCHHIFKLEGHIKGHLNE